MKTTRFFGVTLLASLICASVASAESVTQTVGPAAGWMADAVPFIGFSILITLGSLLPGVIATVRKHDRAFAIWAISLFAGWTVIGWIGALIWACTDPSRCESFPVTAGARPERDHYTDDPNISRSL